jgi:hypothetical protein
MQNRRLWAIAACAVTVLMVAALAIGCGGGTAQKPNVTAIAPDTGPVGTQVTISGQSFGSAQGDGVVHFGDVIATVVAWSDTQITVKVPDKLSAAVQAVTVLTSAGQSNEIDFTVTSGGNQPDSGEGDIEHISAAQAMIAFENKLGKDISDYSFSVVQISDQDPSWKIDVAQATGQPDIYFLLHKKNGNWVVKDDGNALTRAQLTASGAPSDLYGAPTPTSEYQAVLNYVAQQGGNPSGMSVVVTRQSTIDPTWEIGIAHKAGQPDQLVVFHKVSGNWTVVAMGANITYDQMIAMGVPKDIAHTLTEAQAISNWINAGNAPPGVTANGWALKVIDVSSIDPDWEIVQGIQQPGAGTMYFLLHWENNQWVVKDDGGTLTKQDLNAPGMPADLP